MIQNISMPGIPSRGLVFPLHPRAAEFCAGSGIELGAAAHNPFGLPGAINVAPADDESFFAQSQAEMCGEAAVIDIYAEAHAVPLDNASQDYVLSSHVIEHLPDVISAFLEWSRLLKPGGTVFMIVPKPDALPADVGRPASTVDELVEAYEQRYTVETHPYQDQGPRGHHWVFTLESMKALIDHCNQSYGLSWEWVYEEETDLKVGNGFTLVYRLREVEAEKPVRKRPTKKK